MRRAGQRRVSARRKPDVNHVAWAISEFLVGACPCHCGDSVRPHPRRVRTGPRPTTIASGETT
jgi:hypothetical protein